MGLFSFTDNNPASESLVRDILSKNELLNAIVDRIIHDGETDGGEEISPQKWLTHCMGYYDSRKRSIAISSDSIEINWIEIERDEKGRLVESANPNINVFLQFTDFGYVPLHEHKDTNGKTDIPYGRIIYIVAEILKEKLSRALPQCEFSDLDFRYEDNCRFFTYTVPALSWKDWF